MIRKAGPKQHSARQSAEAIRNYMDERTKIKQIINKFGWGTKLSTPGECPTSDPTKNYYYYWRLRVINN